MFQGYIRDGKLESELGGREELLIYRPTPSTLSYIIACISTLLVTSNFDTSMILVEEIYLPCLRSLDLYILNRVSKDKENNIGH